MKRKLNQDELTLCQRKQVDLNDEIKWYEYNVKYLDLMLNEGLELNFKQKLRELKVQKRDFEGLIKMNKDNIKILQQQIREGVEMKDVKGGKE